MINFKQIKLQKIGSLVTIILSGLLLQACGGQRDTPFDSGISSSSSSHGADVAISRLTYGDSPKNPVSDNSIQIKIQDEDTFNTYWNKYSSDTHPIIDFGKSQVLLVDLGKATACDQKLTLSSFAAYQASTNSVSVVLNYTDVDASSSSSFSSSASSSSCGSTLEVQPYFFFQIDTLNELIVDENVN